MHVLLFKRILNFKKTEAKPSDKRATKRHVVGHPFPFKAVITLMPHDEEGILLEDQRSAQAWAGRILNLSETGACIHLHASAVAHRGESCSFLLSRDEYQLELSGSIAHFRTYPQYTSCGFLFNFPNSEMRAAYLQLLEPVAIGAELTALEASKVRQDNAGLVKTQYADGAGAMLSVWKAQSKSEIYSFDFRMNDYGVRWSEGMNEVEPYGLSKLNLSGKKTNSPFVHLTDAELDEVRWLFCLAVPNLSKSVAPDVRKFLGTLVA